MNPAHAWLHLALRAQAAKVDDALRALSSARDQVASSDAQRFAAEGRKNRFLAEWRQLREGYALDPQLNDAYIRLHQVHDAQCMLEASAQEASHGHQLQMEQELRSAALIRDRLEAAVDRQLRSVQGERHCLQMSRDAELWLAGSFLVDAVRGRT